ncbi:hypothetical protein [Mucilaginibacter sp.]|uniref:hypothetical protein n=1 Tax=Mucilaginibacter sp. TaxID=1882438 RepID=UPI00356433DE
MVSSSMLVNGGTIHPINFINHMPTRAFPAGGLYAYTAQALATGPVSAAIHNAHSLTSCVHLLTSIAAIAIAAIIVRKIHVAL